MQHTESRADDSKINSALSLLRQAEALGRAVFTTSLGREDMVVTDLIVSNHLEIELVTLDTGRLFPETYELLERAQAFWRRPILVTFPEAGGVENLVRLHGINGFRNSVPERQQCCQVRKLEPLARALNGAQAWVTGLRRAQSDSRNRLEPIEPEHERGLTKFNPLYDWQQGDVQAYLQGSGIPVNPLYSRGFASIGCQPCTRAVNPDEPERAGRWWWESSSGNGECGLHVRPQAAPEKAL